MFAAYFKRQPLTAKGTHTNPQESTGNDKIDLANNPFVVEKENG